MELTFFNVIIISLFWALGCIVFFTLIDRKKSITVKFNGNSMRKVESVIDYPRTLNITLVESERFKYQDDIVADMVIRMEDLIRGNYSLPDHLKPTFLKEEQTQILPEENQKEIEIDHDSRPELSDAELGEMFKEAKSAMEEPTIIEMDDDIVIDIPDEIIKSVSNSENFIMKDELIEQEEIIELPKEENQENEKNNSTNEGDKKDDGSDYIDTDKYSSHF